MGKRIKKQPIEFSKLMYIVNISFVAIVTGLSFMCIINSGRWEVTDLSPITVICTSAFAELGLHTAGYIHKAKSENVLKIANSIEKGNISDKSINMANKIINQSDITDNYPQG